MFRCSKWMKTTGVLVLLLMLIGQPLLPAHVAGAATAVTVDTTGMTEDGDVSSVAALLANRGADGKISFLEALDAVNADANTGYLINFNLPHGSTITFPDTLYLNKPNTTIDGDVDVDGKPDIVIDGPQTHRTLSIHSSNNVIKHLAIVGFALDGTNAHDNLVAENYFGTDVDGINSRNEPNSGINILVGAYNNTIQNNIIAGNNTNIPPNFYSYGIYIFAGAHDNMVRGNKIGVNANGTALANYVGVRLDDQAAGTYGPTTRNMIGGIRTWGDSTCADPCNIISGNQWNVYLDGTGTVSNTVAGNFIGINSQGNAVSPQSNWGVFLDNGASYNVIGGKRTGVPCYSVCNVISGNLDAGVIVYKNGTNNNQIQGNYIGTNPAGNGSVPNGSGTNPPYAAMLIYNGPANNLIGGDRGGDTKCTGVCNVISGNAGNGIQIQDDPGNSSTNNTIQGNDIGVTGDDLAGLGNGRSGIGIYSQNATTTIGAPKTPALGALCTEWCNVIGGNVYNGIEIVGPGTAGPAAPQSITKQVEKTPESKIARNILPVQTAGPAGSTPSAPKNPVPAAVSQYLTTIQGNNIGVSTDGLNSRPNAAGIVIARAAQRTLIGGARSTTSQSCDGPCNVIDYNTGSGIVLMDSNTVSNTIQGNFIGADQYGFTARPNQGSGIYAYNSAGSTLIGGTRAGGACVETCNLVKGNSGGGIVVTGSSTHGITIRGNSVYSNSNYLAVDLGGDGVTLDDPAGPHPGPNNWMPAPQSVTADYDGTNTTITGIISTTNPTQVTIDIYANTEYLLSGYLEQRRYIGSTKPDSTGAFTLTLSGPPLYSDMHLAATATDSDGNTSEVSIRTPLIFVPGVAGSHLVDPSAIDPDLWPGLGNNHDLLSLYPEDNPSPTITPTEPIRYIPEIAGDHPWLIRSPDQISYGPLLQMLTNTGGQQFGAYRAYQTNGEPAKRTAAGCDMSQKNVAPNLFIDAYDWRLSNADNAKLLKDYVACVQKFYPGARVDVIAHSMGSLLTRRYILDNPGDNHIQRLITIGAPWLGAAKLLYVLESGEFVPIVSDASAKKIVRSSPGPQQLLPSRDYYNLAADMAGYPPSSISATLTSPLGENGWNLDGIWPNVEGYTYEHMIDVLNKRYAHPGVFPVGLTGDSFHAYTNAQGNNQDDWRNDTTGVKYYHFIGIRSTEDTIGSVRATYETTCSWLGAFCSSVPVFKPSFTSGDHTVPRISAERKGKTLDYNFPGAKLYRFYGLLDGDELVEHTGLTRNPRVWQTALDILAQGNSSAADSSGPAKPATAADTVAPAYYVTITGGASPIVTDTLGNSTAVVTYTIPGVVPGVSIYQLTDTVHMLVLPVTGTYTLTFQTTNQPLAVEVTTGTGETTTQATRFKDLTLPNNTASMLKLTPQGVSDLHYDANHDGSFSGVVTPTVSVSGAQANDTEPPDIHAGKTQNGTSLEITLTASDTGSGIRDLYYSVDGTHYQPYTHPFQINPSQTQTIYAIADDNVGNRATLIQPMSAVNNQKFVSYLPVALRAMSSGW